MRAHMTQTSIVHKMKRRWHQVGVSLLELMITLAIGMILMAMAAPLVSTTISTYRLRAAGEKYANLMQRSRMRAVTDDSYYVIYASSVPYAAGINAFADLNNGTGVAAGTYAIAPKADLGIGFNPSVSLRPPAGAPNVNNLYQQFMPGIAANAVRINPNGWAPAGTAVVSFGPRGLPCYLAAAPPGGTCSYTWPAFPTPQPIAFEVFFQNAGINSWEAVTVNPSGRIREWRYSNTSASWQPLD
jgi:hypothetical protein